MAAIDHTCIVWKNGVYIPDPLDYPLPFEYGRDGDIWRIQNSSGTMIDVFAYIKKKSVNDEISRMFCSAFQLKPFREA